MVVIFAAVMQGGGLRVAYPGCALAPNSQVHTPGIGTNPSTPPNICHVSIRGYTRVLRSAAHAVRRSRSTKFQSLTTISAVCAALPDRSDFTMHLNHIWYIVTKPLCEDFPSCALERHGVINGLVCSSTPATQRPRKPSLHAPRRSRLATLSPGAPS